MDVRPRTHYTATVTGTDFPDTKAGFLFFRKSRPLPHALHMNYTSSHDVTRRAAVEISQHLPSGKTLKIGFLEEHFVFQHQDEFSRAQALQVVSFDNFCSRTLRHRKWTVFDLHFDVCA